MTDGTTSTPKKGTVLPSDWQARFLTSLADYGNVTASAKVAHVSRHFLYAQRAADPDFAAAWDAALQQGTAGLEDEARRRAFKGVRREKTIFYKGDPIGKEVVTEYSDTLLIFLLKAHDEKFRDTSRTTNLTIDYASLSEEQLTRIAAGEDILKVLAT